VRPCPAVLTPLLLVCGLGSGLPAAAQETSSKGYIEMPKADDGAWVLTAATGSGRNWGTTEFVRHLALVSREWKRRHPKGPFVRIGDMSKPDGSNFPPHKTHKDGLTADIFTTPKNVCHVNYPDQNLTLELAQLFYDYGAKQILYNGSKVTEALAVARKWPKHDNHFHVVINPSRVPAEGAPLLIPGAGVADGAWVSRADLDETGSNLALDWQLLGGARLKGVRIVFDDLDDSNGVLHDSEQQKLKKPRYVVPLVLDDGKSYRWRLEVETSKGTKASLAWQTLRVDRVPPTVTAIGPKDDAEHNAAPVLRWTFAKPGVGQARYRIELDGDSNHRKVAKALGPFKGTAGLHTLDAKAAKLKRVKRYFWRVIAIDAHGNEGASGWETFRTGRRFGKPVAAGDEPGAKRDSGARSGTVTASLNMRSGPGTKHSVTTVLSKGTPVKILSEADGWLQIRAKAANGKAVTGFVSGKFVRTH
jgi:hypothetical protein